MIRIETGGITSFVEALQASMSETLDHTPPLSHVKCKVSIDTCQPICEWPNNRNMPMHRQLHIAPIPPAACHLSFYHPYSTVV